MAVPADLNTVNNPTAGQPIPAAWGDLVRTWIEFLADPPACSVFNSAVQSVATGTSPTVMTANSENYDNDSMHSTSSNTSRITATTAGRYKIDATVTWAADTGGQRAVSFRVNATDNLAGTQATANQAGAAPTTFTVSQTLTMVAGDYVECQTLQTSGGNLNTTLVQFSAVWLTR